MAQEMTGGAVAAPKPKKFYQSLYVQVLAAIAIGIALGLSLIPI